MHCQGCNSNTATYTKTVVLNDHLVESCNQCGSSARMTGTPDVFFKAPYWDDNLGDEKHPDGQFITSRAHKAAVMKEQGATEAGDRKRGARVDYVPGYGLRNFR